MLKTAINKKYSGYTLFELLVVMSIFVIFAGMSVTAFGGLQNSVKMNEYSLTLEQNIRSVQRAAMLLERDAQERWLYGLGIDFSEITTDGAYKVFKWCSPFEEYGDVTTRSDFPSYDPGLVGGLSADCSGSQNGCLPIADSYDSSSCSISGSLNEIVEMTDFDVSSTPPISDISLVQSNGSDIQYVVFEAVSGRTFLYDSNGALVNYDQDGQPADPPTDFYVDISPLSGASARRISISNLSGRVSTELL